MQNANVLYNLSDKNLYIEYQYEYSVGLSANNDNLITHEHK